MRLKITLTLIVILLGLLTYIFYIDPWQDDVPVADEGSNALGGIAVDLDFVRIVNTATQEAVSIERLESGWMLTEPYSWPANGFAVERILTQLQFLDAKVSFSADRLHQAGSELADFGLAPPELTMELGNGANRSVVGIGKAAEAGDYIYMLSADRSRIHVVDRSLLDSLSIDIETLRNPRIFRTSIFEIDSWNLQLRDAGNLRTRVSKSDEHWIFETPIRTRADSLEVSTLLGKLLNLRSLEILQPTPADLALGLQDPFLRIAVESDQSREALEIGDPVEPENPNIRYAKLENRPTVFTMEIDSLPDIENAQTILRDRDVFEIDAMQASSVSFERGGSEIFTLQKLETNEWEILIPDEEEGIQRQKGSTEAVEDALEWLNEVRAVASGERSGFINDAPTVADLESYGLEVPEFSISLTSSRLKGRDESLQPPKVETLLFGDLLDPREGTTRFVKLAEEDFVYLVSNDILEFVPDEGFRYADRLVFDFPSEAAVNQLSITRLSTGEILLDSGADDGSLPSGLAEALSPLRVKSYLNDSYTTNVSVAGNRQSWAYLLKADYQWADGDEGQTETVEIYMSELTGGPFLAGGSIDEDTVFEFRQPFIDAFSSIVFDRVKRDVPEEPFDPEVPLPAESADSTSDANE